MIGIRTWELHLEGCHSLKDKRSVLKPVTTALRRTLNVSVAETDHQDLWQRAEIACAAVGSPTTERIAMRRCDHWHSACARLATSGLSRR